MLKSFPLQKAPRSSLGAAELRARLEARDSGWMFPVLHPVTALFYVCILFFFRTAAKLHSVTWDKVMGEMKCSKDHVILCADYVAHYAFLSRY